MISSREKVETDSYLIQDWQPLKHKEDISEKIIYTYNIMENYKCLLLPTSLIKTNPFPRLMGQYVFFIKAVFL